jgi:tetratricopeptide (TPR) repeat protein
MRQKRHLEALEIFDSLLQQHPKSFMGFRNRGLCLLHLRNVLEAKRNFESALSLFPQFSDAKLDLAVTQFIQGRKKEAEELAAQVRKVEPNNLRAAELLEQCRRFTP